MKTKLTLRMEEAVIERAKSHSKRLGKSLSQMVAAYFALLDDKAPAPEDLRTTPLVKSLKGIMRAPETDLGDYRKYLEEKYL